MPTPVLICDDSSFARKQMARALPKGWDVDVSFAGNGAEALDAIKAGKADILFLDLNMPVMDGYEALAAIRAQDLPTMTIVVSGDIQPEAQARVTQLGAMAFLKKPVGEEEIARVLTQYGIRGTDKADVAPVQVEVDIRDGYKEVANVAMGQAADFLARLLNVFVLMPVPHVNMIDSADLRMALGEVAAGENISAVCQGFIGAGIAGEALLLFQESSFQDIAELTQYQGKIDENAELELLMDMANILIGACLKGLADQLEVNFSQGPPVVLGRHVKVSDLLKGNALRWKQTLAIEMGYRIENRKISCDLLLLLTEDSIASLNTRLQYLIG
jgi:chemotaxis protein CheY-P-specific phosphatase CheC/CheY-like chemotaxis protein